MKSPLIHSLISLFVLSLFLTACQIPPTVQEYKFEKTEATDTTKETNTLSVTFVDKHMFDTPEANPCNNIKVIISIRDAKSVELSPKNLSNCGASTVGENNERHWTLLFDVTPYDDVIISEIYLHDNWSGMNMSLDGKRVW